MSKFDFHWIVPGLAQGAYPGSSGVTARFDKTIFDTFDVVVLCAEELQPRIKPPNKKEIFRIPLDDDDYRPIPDEVAEILHESARRLATYCAHGQSVLTTCAQGRNRSGVLNGLILMYGYKMTPQQAIKLIQKKRPVGALANTMFTQFLMTTQLQ